MDADGARGHTVQLDQFEGPLDLLIFLIRKNDVNIYDIPIARITEQYLEYLEYAARIDLDTITDFYAMAATLIYIKSRMLLPARDVDDDEEYDDPRQELVEKLIEYQKYRKLSDLIADRNDEIDYTIERKGGQPILPFDDDQSLWEEIDVWQLVKTFSHVIRNISTDRLITLYEEVTVNEKLTLILELIDSRDDFPFTDLIVRADSIMEIVCAFIAILEAARQKTVMIYQNRMFGDIRIAKRQ
jgi:segregation and condensation protein A